MGKEIIAIGNIEVGKHKFHQHKTPISIYDLNDDRIVESNKVFWVKKHKYFILCENDYEKVLPLRIIFRRMSAYRKDFDETKYMSFLIKNSELLQKYNGIWNKVSNIIKKRIS